MCTHELTVVLHYTRTRTHAYTHTHAHTHTNIHRHTPTYTQAHTERERERENVCIVNVWMRVCARMHACECVRVCARSYVR